MDSKSTENYENGFDDNGLQHALMLASEEDIASHGYISENDAEDSPLCDYDVIPTGKDEADDTEVEDVRAVPFDDESGSISLAVFSEAVHLADDDGNVQFRMIPKNETDSKRQTDRKDNFDLFVCRIIKKEEAKDEDGGSAIIPGEVKTKEAKLRTGRSAKDGGRLKNITDLDIHFSMVYFVGTIYAKISYQFPFSLAIGLLLLLPSVGVDGALTSLPANTLVAVEETARINCSTDLNQPVFWARTPPQSDVQQWLYYGSDGFNRNNADARFSVDKDLGTGRYDLIISDVQQKDAGRYVCFDESGIGAKASAELVITDPIKCNSHIPIDGFMGNNVFGLEQDFIQISCSLTYTGNLSPTLEWSWPGSDVQSDEHNVSTAKSSVTSTLKLTPTKKQNGVKFQCKANIGGATQRSIIGGRLWESDTVNVKYAEFSAEEVNACPNVEWNLVCNPQCSYSFEESKDRGCRCQYTYHDNRTQQNYTVDSYTVRCAKDNENLPVVVIIIIIIATLLAVVITLSVCLKMKQKRRDEPANPCKDGEAGKTLLQTNDI